MDKPSNLDTLLAWIHLILSLLFNVGFLGFGVWANTATNYNIAIDAYVGVTEAIMSPLIIVSYLALLFTNRRVAVKWWRLLLTLLPLIYLTAILYDMYRFGLTYRDIINPNTPVIFEL